MTPRRIWIVGPCGAGKSSVARRLSDATGIPVYYLDNMFWKPGWRSADANEFRRAVERVVASSEWIIDGNYPDTCRESRSMAELVVWLDLPLHVTLPRLLGRCCRRVWRREAICNGNYESFLMTFATRDSILWWALRSDHNRRVNFAKELRGRSHVRLRTQAQIDAWMDQWQAGTRGATR